MYRDLWAFDSYNWFKYWHSAAGPAADDCQLFSHVLTHLNYYIYIYNIKPKLSVSFHSQGMILNGFWKNHFSEYVCGTWDPPPFMEKSILNLQFDYLKISLMDYLRERKKILEGMQSKSLEGTYGDRNWGSPRNPTYGGWWSKLKSLVVIEYWSKKFC